MPTSKNEAARIEAGRRQYASGNRSRNRRRISGAFHISIVCRSIMRANIAPGPKIIKLILLTLCYPMCYTLRHRKDRPKVQIGRNENKENAMLFEDKAKSRVGKPEPIKFQLTQRGKYRIALPYKDAAFIREFRAKVAPHCRFYRPDKEAWEITPLPEAGLDYLRYVAEIVEKHFERPVHIIHITEAEEQAMLAEIEAEIEATKVA